MTHLFVNKKISVIVAIVLLITLYMPQFAYASEVNAYEVTYNSIFVREDGSYEFRLTEYDEQETAITCTVVKPLTESCERQLQDLMLRDGMTMTKNKVQFDSTSLFSVSLTVNGSGIEDGYLEYWKVTRVSVSINGADGTTGSYVGSGVYIISQSSTATTQGILHGTNAWTNQNATVTKSASIRNWSYITPMNNWDYAYIAANTLIGASVSVTARRGSSGTPWTTNVVVNLYNTL